MRMLSLTMLLMTAVATAAEPLEPSTNALPVALPREAVVRRPKESLVNRPANEVLVDLARQEYTAANMSKASQEAVQARMRALDRSSTVEGAGSAGRYLQQRRSWRGVADLINPFAPVTRMEPPAATAFETRRALDFAAPDSLRRAGSPAVPRAFRDVITHEYGVRLW